MATETTAQAGAATPLKVFISYSREDMAFADALVAGLDYGGGFEVAIDRHSIHEGEEWRGRLGALIAEADTVVFVLSPSSAASPVCAWEVEEADRLSKRILPVLAKPLDGVAPPPQLAALNYVVFDASAEGGPVSFLASLESLRQGLNTDLGWLREHTRLLTRAREWDGAGRVENRMLSGPDIAAAKAWLDARPRNAPSPTELHRDFIQASEQAETARMSAERERVERLALAVGRARRRLVLVGVVALAALGVGAWAMMERARSAAALEQASARLDVAGEAVTEMVILDQLVRTSPSDVLAVAEMLRESDTEVLFFSDNEMFQTIGATDAQEAVVYCKVARKLRALSENAGGRLQELVLLKEAVQTEAFADGLSLIVDAQAENLERVYACAEAAPG